MDLIKFNSDEFNTKLNDLHGWKTDDYKLRKLFKFKTFMQAIHFINKVALVCEEMNHHPSWTNVYGNVDVILYTHKVAGLTDLDFILASKMDQIFEELN